MVLGVLHAGALTGRVVAVGGGGVCGINRRFQSAGRVVDIRGELVLRILYLCVSVGRIVGVGSATAFAGLLGRGFYVRIQVKSTKADTLLKGLAVLAASLGARPCLGKEARVERKEMSALLERFS